MHIFLLAENGNLDRAKAAFSAKRSVGYDAEQSVTASPFNRAAFALSEPVI